MGNENPAVRSWLPQAGTAERTLILKKLKRDLDKRGMTRHEVYKGLLQLTTTARVLLKKWSNPDRMKKPSRGNDKIAEHEDLTSLKRIDRNSIAVRDVETTEAKSRETKIIDASEDSSRPRKSMTPELLDEKVGKDSCFIVKIPRKAITLNFTARKSSTVKVSLCAAAPSTEIRMADSSVSDTETTPAFRPSITQGIRKRNDNVNATHIASKKPKIVEDVTCIEGTIIARTSFKNLPIAAINHRNIIEATSNVRSNDEEKEKILPIVRTTNIIKNKMRSRMITCASRKQRLRRKFRQIFGGDSTLSELEEEDDIIDRFIHRGIAKRGRNSLDSGIGSVDLNSDDIVVGSRGNFIDFTRNRECQLTREPSPVSEIKEEENNVTSKPSMPLLDSSSTSESNNSRDAIVVEALPDSSTSINFFSEADSSSDESTDSSEGKLIIFESPEKIESPVIPTIVSQDETDLRSRCSTPTPATSPFSVLSNPRTNDECEKSPETTDLSEYLEMDVFSENCAVILQGNTISIRENAKCEASSEDVAREEENIDNVSMNPGQSGSLRSNAIFRSVIVSTDNYSDESERSESVGATIKDENIDGEKTQLLVTVTEVPACDTRESDLSPSTREHESTRIDGEKEAISTVTDKCPAAPLLPSLPKLRVLHPSELGSRWCPTPLNTDASLLHRDLIEPVVSHSPFTPDPSYLPTFIENPELFHSNYSPRCYDANVATRRGDSSSVNASELPNDTSNLSSNVPGQLSAGSLVTSLFGSIMRLFVCLDWCIGRNKLVYSRYEAMELRDFFNTKKTVLWEELRKFSSVVGTSSLGWIVEYIVKIYERITPPGKRFFNVKKVETILLMRQLPPAYLISKQAETHCAPSTIPKSPYQRPPPPSYPVSYNSPENSVPFTPRQFDFSIDTVLRPSTTGGLSRPATSLPQTPIHSTTTIFTPRQLEILKDQIAQYNYLLNIRPKQSSRRPARQRKTRTKSSVVKGAKASATVDCPSNKENESTMPPPTAMMTDEILPNNRREYRSSNVSAALSSVQPGESFVQSSDFAVRSSDKQPETKDNHCLESIGDILETLVVLSSSSSKIHPNKSKENLIGAKTTYFLPTNTNESSFRQETNVTVDAVHSLIDESTKNDCANDEAIEEIKEPRCSVNEANNDVEALNNNRVPVITLDDHDSADNTDDPEPNEDRPNFSILDVKSISKDVFNNIGDENTGDSLTLKDVRSVENEKNQVSAVIIEPRECLRCGEPSSVVCEQCYEAFYCSSECHEAHWTETHYLICKPVPAEALAQFESGDTPNQDNFITQG